MPNKAHCFARLQPVQTLVLKVEKEREDALDQVKQLKEHNAELQEALDKAHTELAQVHQERNVQRIGEWLDSASGLSHVRATAAANAVAAESAGSAANAPPASPPSAPAPPTQQESTSLSMPSLPSPGASPAKAPAFPMRSNLHRSTSTEHMMGLEIIREDQPEDHGVAPRAGSDAPEDGATPAATPRSADAAATAVVAAITAAVGGTLAGGDVQAVLAAAVGRWETELQALRSRVKQLESELSVAQEAHLMVGAALGGGFRVEGVGH